MAKKFGLQCASAILSKQSLPECGWKHLDFSVRHAWKLILCPGWRRAAVIHPGSWSGLKVLQLICVTGDLMVLHHKKQVQAGIINTTSLCQKRGCLFAKELGGRPKQSAGVSRWGWGGESWTELQDGDKPGAVVWPEILRLRAVRLAAVLAPSMCLVCFLGHSLVLPHLYTVENLGSAWKRRVVCHPANLLSAPGTAKAGHCCTWVKESFPACHPFPQSSLFSCVIRLASYSSSCYPLVRASCFSCLLYNDYETWF